MPAPGVHKRRNFPIAILLLVCGLSAPAAAQSRNFSVQGFGGLTFGDSSFVSGTSTAPSVGGLVTAAITPNILVVGEVGRLSEIRPSLFELLDYTPIDLNVSAWYGQGGVRVTTSGSAVRPYGEATGGMARLSAGISGLGERADELLELALPYLNDTQPMLGLGAACCSRAVRSPWILAIATGRSSRTDCRQRSASATASRYTSCDSGPVCGSDRALTTFR